MRRLFVSLFFVEVGVALILLPWSGFWDRNYFGQVVPAVGVVMRNNFVRGGVSGLGLLNLVAGVADIVAFVGALWQDRGAAITGNHRE